MYLTDKEIEYIFGDSADKSVPYKDAKDIFGKTEEEIAYGEGVFKGIDDRLKAEFGLPLSTRSIFDYPNIFQAINTIETVNFSKSYRPSRATNVAQAFTSRNPSVYENRIFPSIVSRRGILLNLINNNVLLLKDFLIKSGISQHNIDSLTFQDFSKKCKSFFGSNVIVTPQMFKTFKNFVKTNVLANDLSLMAYNLCTRLSVLKIESPLTQTAQYKNLVAQHTAEMSQTASVSQILSDICKNDKTNNPHLTKFLKNHSWRLAADFDSIKKQQKQHEFGILSIVTPLGRFYNAIERFMILEQHSLKSQIPTMYFSKKAFEETFYSMNKAFDEAEKIISQRKEEMVKAQTSQIKELSKNKDIEIASPENANEMIQQKFTSFDEMANFIASDTTSEKMFVDIENLTVYTCPEESEFDNIDTKDTEDNREQPETDITINKDNTSCEDIDL